MSLLKSISAIIVLAICIPQGKPQDQVFAFTGSFDMAFSDPFGNFYMVSADQLSKTDSTGRVLFSFSDPGRGNISCLDASDPFRVLVYYRSFNTVLFLDRTLSPITEPVQLDELGIFSPAGLCRSSQGGIWIIDQSTGSLIQLGRNLDHQVNIRLEGFDFIFQGGCIPMAEWKERLYVCRPEKDVIQFDLFGTMLKSIPVKAHAISTLEYNLAFSGSQSLYRYSDYPWALDEIPVSLPAWDQLIISKNHALLQDRSGWRLFKLKIF